MVEGALSEREGGGAGPSGYRPTYALLSLLLIVGCLIAYKATASLAVIGKVQATGVIKPRFDLIPTAASSAWGGTFDRTLSYFLVVWPVLLFGILISGGARARSSARVLPARRGCSAPAASRPCSRASTNARRASPPRSRSCSPHPR